MTEGFALANDPAAADKALRADLARGDAVLDSLGPILRHLLGNTDSSLFGDEIIAVMRGMIADLVRQLVGRVAVAVGQGLDPVVLASLTDKLSANVDILIHIHSLAIEAQLAGRLEHRLGLDPVLSPLLRELIASDDQEMSALAMKLLAAQARFIQQCRRMQLALAELPAELVHQALALLREAFGHDPQAKDTVRVVEAELRSGYDESRGRLSLIAQVIDRLGGGVTAALSLPHAGLAIFLTAIAEASSRDRDGAVALTSESQIVRLALALGSAGLKPASVVAQLEALHPDVVQQPYYHQLAIDHANRLLAGSPASGMAQGQ